MKICLVRAFSIEFCCRFQNTNSKCATRQTLFPKSHFCGLFHMVFLSTFLYTSNLFLPCEEGLNLATHLQLCPVGSTKCVCWGPISCYRWLFDPATDTYGHSGTSPNRANMDLKLNVQVFNFRNLICIWSPFHTN